MFYDIAGDGRAVHILSRALVPLRHPTAILQLVNLTELFAEDPLIFS